MKLRTSTLRGWFMGVPLIVAACGPNDREPISAATLALTAQQYFGPDRVDTAENLRDAIDIATAFVDEVDAEGESFSGTGIVITGSVVTAGAARTLYGRDPA